MSSEPGHLLVLNQYVVPDHASTGRIAFEVARVCAMHGASVKFIAGQPSYLPDQPPGPVRETRDGVEIIRVRMHGARGRKHRRRRFAGYVIYLLGAARAGLKMSSDEPLDTVLCFHNPPFLPLVGALIAWRRRCELVFVVQDIHPDVLIATDWIALPRPVRAGWNWLNRLAFDRASRIVVLSGGMRSVLIGKGVDAAKVLVIPLWAEPELEPRARSSAVRSRYGVGEDDLMLLFAGNFGVTQDLQPVLAAAESLVDAPVRFVFVGDGVNQRRWGAQTRALANVVSTPFQSDADYRELVAAADAGIVTLAPGLERLVVPSRAFPFLSAGRPLLAVMAPSSELGRLVEAHGCGARVSSAHDLAQVVTRWLADPDTLLQAGSKARALYASSYTRAGLSERYVELLVRA